MKSCLECQYSKQSYPDGDMDDPLCALECRLTGEDLGYGDTFPVPSLCPLTKKGCLHHHRKKWNWIADEIEKRDRVEVSEIDYLRSIGADTKMLDNDCYAYTYANSHYPNNCSTCPIPDWQDGGCTKHDTSFMQFLCATTPQDASEAARKVASLAKIKDGKKYQLYREGDT